MDEFDISNTSLPIKIINRADKDKHWFLGRGDEGEVRELSENTAYKIFWHSSSIPERKLKFRKIEVLGKICDPSVTFPKGLVGYETRKKEGYYTKRIHEPEHPEEIKNFDDLTKIFKTEEERVRKIIMESDEIMQRLHKRNIFVGDVKGSNILIDESFRPIFIDTDNYAVEDLTFGPHIWRIEVLERAYNQSYSYEDIDKFLFGVLGLEFYLNGLDLQIKLASYDVHNILKELLKLLNARGELKEGLEILLSDAHDKPYFGSILEKIKPGSKLLTLNKRKSLEKNF